MSKSILVIDTPDKCSMCKFINRTDEGYCYCRVFDFDYQINQYMSTPKEKPDWCPLKEIPKKRSHNLPDCRLKVYDSGWNDCLDEILGEE